MRIAALNESDDSLVRDRVSRCSRAFHIATLGGCHCGSGLPCDAACWKSRLNCWKSENDPGECHVICHVILGQGRALRGSAFVVRPRPREIVFAGWFKCGFRS